MSTDTVASDRRAAEAAKAIHEAGEANDVKDEAMERDWEVISARLNPPLEARVSLKRTAAEMQGGAKGWARPVDKSAPTSQPSNQRSQLEAPSGDAKPNGGSRSIAGDRQRGASTTSEPPLKKRKTEVKKGKQGFIQPSGTLAFRNV